MRDEIKVLIESWPEKSNSKYLQLEIHDYRLRTIDIIFGLGNAQLVEQHIRRQNIGLARASDIRIWLAYTEYSALDWVCRSIIQSPDLLESFTEAIKAPEAAPYMLELWLSLKTPQLARQWLEDNPVEAIVGLIPVAAGNVHPPINVKPSEMSRGALDFLKSMKRKGFDSIIQAALERESPEIAERIRVKIFNSEDLSYIPFDSHNTPKWLTLQVNEFRKFNSTKVCTWVAPADLPLLIVEENSLNTEQVAMCLFALKQSTLDSPHPLIPNLKKHCNQHSLDAFAWSLFQRWLTEGAPSKEKWAMAALGLLGSDSIALKLTPLIRQYPAENQHLRAVFGLECLRAIGSDTALMQIHGIAQKVKYQGLKKRANECLQAIARERKLTKEQLEDRIIPDLGLDARGQRVFDFGARQFQFILGDDLKPRVRDEKGKLSTNLPKPGAKDNPELAHQAIADWKLLKKQIEQVVKIQSLRLEKAMIVERHWQWLEFESLLVRHPLMTNLVQRLVWGGYNSSGEMLGTFRVAEDQTYANESDEEFIPEGMMTVVVVHPLKLTDSERAAWTQAFSDYEIIPPFPQINREIYTLQPQESQEKEITRFKDILIPGLTLARKMEHLGWVRGRLHDHGDYRVHYKYFAKANVTAIIGDYENQHVEQSSIWGDDAIDGCCFFTGDFSPYEYPEPGSWYHRQTQKEHLLLGEIDPLVMSEVLRDLYTVTAKAK
ncbi:DUF4132 domain-containing protein [Tolypothrix bouteillei]|nr:DUF4132 domain-containing protein [Tolypothrix bouteillei]KAF3885660.1 DUF4132 domain-containing protein [Tolypothrix bouteillei VB521301]